MGAPTIVAEKLVGGREFHDGMTVINSLLNAGTHSAFLSRIKNHVL